jgi:cation transport protein ChaC
MGDFWVFGYGSLIWRPGFDFLEEQKALLHGWRRGLCVHSWVHRGSRDAPGLVLGLDRGGSCAGLARKVSADKRDQVIQYLRERELVTNVYLEKWVTIRLANGERAKAVTYVVDQNHDQYAKPMSVAQLVAIIKNAEGKSGNNQDYVFNTVTSLKTLGIRDKVLEQIVAGLTK